MKILVTGAAGFIGFHLIKKLISNNNEVIGIDNLNDYYDIKLKYLRLESLKKHPKSTLFSFFKEDLCNKDEITNLFKKNSFDIVINLAAQAGVRYSLKDPDSYIKSNINGFKIREMY